MDNPAAVERLQEGAKVLGIEVSEEVAQTLLRFGSELLKWNAKINLTAVTAQDEVLEKHLLDSLAVLPEVAGSGSLLDVGAGGGFPGIPLKIALPDLDVTLAETVGKKVGFMKYALASLGLKKARALQVRVEGNPKAEGLGSYDRVVSRAFTDVERWVPLATPYLKDGGQVVAMVGKQPDTEVLSRVSAQAGIKKFEVRGYALPFSGDPRSVISFQR